MSMLENGTDSSNWLVFGPRILEAEARGRRRFCHRLQTWAVSDNNLTQPNTSVFNLRDDKHCFFLYLMDICFSCNSW
jgi:hypothetical protein